MSTSTALWHYKLLDRPENRPSTYSKMAFPELLDELLGHRQARPRSALAEFPEGRRCPARLIHYLPRASAIAGDKAPMNSA